MSWHHGALFSWWVGPAVPEVGSDETRGCQFLGWHLSYFSLSLGFTQDLLHLLHGFTTSLVLRGLQASVQLILLSSF